jgi:hypothetical protein
MSAIWDGNCAYLFGGYDGYSYFDHILRYDPVQDQLTTMNATLPMGIKWMSAVWTGTYAYIFGGRTASEVSNQIVRYDPIADSATVVSATSPENVMATSAVWTGSYAYIFGGRTMENVDSSSIFKYDPVLDSCSLVGESLPSPRAETCAIWAGQSGFIFGGSHPPQIFDEIVRFAPEDTGLIGYWKFDEGSGNVAYDSSGNNNDGVIVNATYSNDAPCLESNFSLEFSGTLAPSVSAYSYVTIPDSPSLRPNLGLTVEAWIKAFNVQGRHILAKEYGAGTDDSYALWYDWDSYLRFGIKTQASSVGVPIPSMDQWHHIAGVCDGSYLRLYVDGNEVVSGQFSIQLLYDSNPVLIGADDNNGDDIPDEVWNGLIDEVKIYDYARTPEEIWNDYSGCITLLSASISPLSASISVGSSVTFASTVSGGPPPYSYQWYLNNNPISGATLNTWAFTPATAGNYAVHLNVTDNLGNIAKSNEASVAVAAQLVASISPMSASVLVGQPVAFASTVSGGYAPYSYQWYLNGNPVSGATSNTWTFTPTAIGTYNLYLKVTDSYGNATQSEAAHILVATPTPVGGYSFPVGRSAKANPLTLYLAFMLISTIVFTTIKRRATRRTESSPKSFS